MNYNSLAIAIYQIEQLQKVNIELEVILLQAHGIKLAPKQNNKPNTI